MRMACAPQGERAERVPCPWWALLAFAPTLSGLVGPPGAAILVVLAHLHAVLAAPAFGLYLLAFGLILYGKAREQRFQPCQQALFIAIPERHLHRATIQGDMHIGAGRRLWQGWDCLTLGLCLGLLGWWLTGAIAGLV